MQEENKEEKIEKNCECMCYICGRGDKYYKGCSCDHSCCRGKDYKKLK